MFVDTGANGSLLSKKLVRKHLPNARWIPVRHYSTTAKSDGRINIIRKLAVKIKIGRQAYRHEFWIAEDLSVDVIFGLDLMKRFGVKIDMEKCTIEAGKESVELKNEHLAEVTCNLLKNHDCELSPE